MIKLPSLQRPYVVHYIGDPALKQPPSKPPATATDDEVLAYRKAIDEYATTVLACQDTGDWSPLIIEGQVPTSFLMGQVDRHALRSISDRFGLPDSNPRHIGQKEYMCLLVRLALLEIDGVKVAREPDPIWNDWTLAKPEVINMLDGYDSQIVSDLGWVIHRRVFHLGPKSSRA